MKMDVLKAITLVVVIIIQMLQIVVNPDLYVKNLVPVTLNVSMMILSKKNLLLLLLLLLLPLLLKLLL
eukprot:jgi/Orpsp1_1/1176424/evm.model.c7180000057543.1